MLGLFPSQLASCPAVFLFILSSSLHPSFVLMVSLPACAKLSKCALQEGILDVDFDGYVICCSLC